MRAALRGARALVPAGVLLLNGCGASQDPPPPVVVVTPVTTTPGGVINGKYMLRIEPARECNAPRSVLTFRVDARPDDGRRPGFAITLELDPRLDMELIYATPNVQGNIGQTHDPVLAAELPTVGVWIHGVVVGAVSSESGGPGEVVQGTMAGHVAFNEENATCFSTAHRWSLRLR
jgi:hypothetical protein